MSERVQVYTDVEMPERFQEYAGQSGEIVYRYASNGDVGVRFDDGTVLHFHADEVERDQEVQG